MKITYLGTAAAEGFPAVFCNCAFCNESRRLGGKNIRTRSQSLINDDLLIDLPADTYYHFLTNGIEGDKIKHLIVTHSHSDHFYPKELLMRTPPYSHDMRAPIMDLLCSSVTASKIVDQLPPTVKLTVIKAYDTVKLGDYEITALPANHMKGGEALFYIIKGDRTLLYAHDTGGFFDHVFDYIRDNKIVFDMISLDCTNVDIPIDDEGSHMGFSNHTRVLARLESIGAINDATLKYVNHFSHNGNPLQSILEDRAATNGCSVAYDGCVVEI